MSQPPPQPFDALVPAPMSVVHHYASELHRVAADVCCSLAAATLATPTGLLGRKTVHVGAGFGADARAACFHGAREAVGLDSAPEQVAFDRAFHELDDEALGRTLYDDEVSRRLYSAETLRRAARSLLTERRHLRNLPWPAREEVRRADVLSVDLSEAAGGPADAMIGNFMLHWLQVGEKPLAWALDKLAPALCPGRIAVFSVPYHLVQSRDEAEHKAWRARTAYSTPLYQDLIARLMPRVAGLPQADVMTMESSKVASIVVKDADAEVGSGLFEHVQTTTRYFGCEKHAVVDTLRGAALYEATFRSNLPARLLAGLVADAVDEAVAAVGPAALAKPAGTFIRFYVFRRKRR